MKKSYLLVTIFSFFISLSAWSQVEKGVELFLLEDYDEAKKAFEQSTSQNPDLSYYYLGEIALRKKNTQEAANYYEKGLAADVNAVFSRIGKTKLDLKSNPEEFKKAMKAITSKNKKNSPVLLAAAQAYYDNNLPGEATNAYSMARNANKRNPYVYIFEGDRLKGKAEPGNAATQYEQAINFDPKCAVAYIKNSMVYESISSTTAINTLKAGLEAIPDHTLIRKYLARSYFKNGFYEQAIAEYDKLSREQLQAEDLRNKAASFYFAGKYNEALANLNQIASTDSDNPVINRLLMYTHDKLKNIDEVVTIGKKFFSLPGSGDSFNYLVTDYTVYAEALMAKKEIDEAIVIYEKAIVMEPEKAGPIYKEMASMLNSADRQGDAAIFQQKYIDAVSSEEASDYLQLGLYNYRTAGQFSSKVAAIEKGTAEGNVPVLRDSMAQYVANADKAFAKVIELSPDSYQGYYWRANANTLLDPDLSKGLANNDYLKMIQILTENNGNDSQNRFLIEAYRYFSIYHLYQFDANKQADQKTKAREYAEKVLQLKPDDDTSKKILEVLNN